MYFFDFNTLVEQVIKVELIDYNFQDVQQISSEDELLSFDFDKMEIIETLDQDQFNEFFQDLSIIEFHETVDYSETPLGISVLISYNNGNFVIISSSLIDDIAYGGAMMYDSAGTVIEFYGNFATRQQYVDLVNTYFDITID